MKYAKLFSELHKTINLPVMVSGLIIGLIIPIFIQTPVLAQGGSALPQGKSTANNADQNIGSVARVNPSTLGMEFGIPLANYPGRNGSSLPVGISYSSKLWRMKNLSTYWYQLPYSCTRQYVTQLQPLFAERSAAGWTSSISFPIIEEKSELYTEAGKPFDFGLDENLFNILAQTNITNANNGNSQNFLYACGASCGGWTQVCVDGECSSWSCTGGWWTHYCDDGFGGGGGSCGNGYPTPTTPHYVKRVRVRMGDATHEFRQSDEIFEYDPATGADNTGIYLAVDGSGMRLERTNTGSILYLPNGGRYIFPAVSTQGYEETAFYKATDYYDADGNRVSFAETTAGGKTVRTLTDTLGRAAADPLPKNLLTQEQQEGISEVYLPSMDGRPAQKYEMKWLHLKPVACENGNTSNCGSAEGALENQAENTYYYTSNICFGNYYGNTLTNGGVAMFPANGIGLRSCNPFTGDTSLNAVGTTFNPVVLAEVKLPNGKKYEFKYNQYGEITKITYPTGAYEKFTYDYIQPLEHAGTAYDQVNRGVKEHRVFNADGIPVGRTKYEASYNLGTNTYKVVAISPKLTSDINQEPMAEGMRSERFLYQGSRIDGKFGFDDILAGAPYEERSYDDNGVLRSRTLTEYLVCNLN